jgi:hypothetical protein
MVRHGLKHIFQKPTPDIDSSDRTQQLRSKTIYAGTVNLAQTLANGTNNRYKTYNGPYEVATQAGNSNLIASRSYDDFLSITKGKVLLNQLPLNPSSRDYYQKNFAKGQMYEGNYNHFDPSHNFIGHTGCNNSVLVYDTGSTGFTGLASYDANGGFIGVTGPIGTGVNGGSDNNKRIFIDPNHCYYSDPCLIDASYTRFVSPGLTGATGMTGGAARFNAQQIISADQYRGFSYPMSNFNLTCVQQLPNQAIGPLFCLPEPPANTAHPVISGSTLVGSVLTVTINGTWSNDPTSYTYQWYRGATPIPSQTTASYTTQQADIGSALTCQVFANNSGGGSAPATSNSIVVATPSIVAVGQGTNTFVGSSNRTTWIPSSNGNALMNSGSGVAWNGSVWVAVGGGISNTIVTSSDGITWTPSSNGNTIFTRGNGVAWNGSLWVAVGVRASMGTSFNTIATSTNGTNWFPSSNGNTIFDSCRGVAWNGSLWVAVGNGTNTIATSTDGVTWSGLGPLIFTLNTANDGGNGVAWNGSNRWVAVGSGTTNTIATSTDGTSWIGRGNSVFTTGGNGVAYNGSDLWVAVGSGTNTIATSTDGTSWIGCGNSVFTTSGNSVAWNSSLSIWIAVGSGTNSIATSSNGITWDTSGNGNSVITIGNGVASK